MKQGEHRSCEVCGSPFYATPIQVRNGYGRYCSMKCSGQARSKETRGTRIGADNPNYRHGKRAGGHLRGWGVSHKGGPCRSCGAQSVDLHHAIPRSQWQAGKRDLRNGMPLCKTCHSKWHMKTLKIYRDAFTREEWEFLLTADLTGRVTEAWLDDNYPQRPVL